MTPRLANLLTLLVLVGLFVAISFTAPRWARYFRQPLPVPEDEGNPVGPTPAPGRAGDAERTIRVKLFFEARDRPGLLMEERTVTLSQDLPRQIRSVVEELIRGPEGELLPTLDKATKVLDVFVTARGVAYVDFSKEALASAGGSSEELLSVYSVVDSITMNFPAVRRVQILVDGHPAETLAGHVDLARPLPPDLTFMAEILAPAPGAAPSPGPAPSPAS